MRLHPFRSGVDAILHARRVRRPADDEDTVLMTDLGELPPAPKPEPIDLLAMVGRL